MMPLCIFLVLLSQMYEVSAVNKTSSITQHSGVITAKVGETVTLECYCQDEAVTFLSWYQQRLGDKPLIISTRMKHNTEASVSPAYKKRFRVLATGQDGINHLIITDVHLSDSATYYCGVLEFNAIEFGQGAFLHVRTTPSNTQAVIHQPELEPLRSGESVNLSCTAYFEPCAGEQSFYWFRHGAAQSAVMYPSAGQCINIPNEDSHVKNCTSNLSLKSVSPPDAGIYYCALASCGEIMFGSGRKVKIVESPTQAIPPLVYCLTVALAVSIIVLLVLAFIMYKLQKKSCSVCKGTVSHVACSAASEATSQDADILHYAALNVNRTSEQHRQEDNVGSVCVYSRVKSRKE